MERRYLYLQFFFFLFGIHQNISLNFTYDLSPLLELLSTGSPVQLCLSLSEEILHEAAFIPHPSL